MKTAELTQSISEFLKERDWEKFHSSRNIAIGLSIEASELLEVFLWLSEDECENLSDEGLVKLKEEIGDVMLYLVELAGRYNLDPLDCAKEKLEKNKRKYPADKVRGSSKKYTHYY